MGLAKGGGEVFFDLSILNLKDISISQYSEIQILVWYSENNCDSQVFQLHYTILHRL